MLKHSRTCKSRKPLPPRLEWTGVGNSDNKTQEIRQRGHPTGADYKEAQPITSPWQGREKAKGINTRSFLFSTLQTPSSVSHWSNPIRSQRARESGWCNLQRSTSGYREKLEWIQGQGGTLRITGVDVVVICVREKQNRINGRGKAKGRGITVIL